MNPGIASTIQTQMNGNSLPRCWRVYVCMDDPNWELQAFFGDSVNPMEVNASGGFFQEQIVGGFLTENLNPAFFPFFPELEFDSWFTIGVDDNTSVVQIAPSETNIVSEFNTQGTTGFVVNDIDGLVVFGAWTAENSQGVPDSNNKVLIAQFTTDGVWDATFNFQFRKLNPDGTLFLPITVIQVTDVAATNMPGQFVEACPANFNVGCTDPEACNFLPDAYFDNGSCDYFCCTNFDACNYIGILSGNPTDENCCFDFCASMQMEDSAGDGWNGISYVITNQQNGNTVASGGLADGFDELDNFCIEEGCYSISVSGGVGQEEVSWILTGSYFNGFSLSGGAPEELTFTVGQGCVEGCMDSQACNYNSEANIEDGSCLFNDVCGICGGNSIADCTVQTACNYNATATCDDGSCEYETCSGCTDETSCTYDPTATIDNGICLYLDNCGNCVESPVSGCTDPLASNYNPYVTCDDGTCCYENWVEFILDGNYPEDVVPFYEIINLNDGSVIISGNFNGDQVYELFCLPDGCYSLEVSGGETPYYLASEVFDWNPEVTSLSAGSLEAPIFQVFHIGDGICIEGCTVENACNFSPEAQLNNGSCTYPGCTDETACNYNETAGCDDGSCIYPDGCTDETACNYNSTALCDDGSCSYPGCNDETAANYNPSAGCDDGSCIEAFGSYLVPDVLDLMYNENLDLEIWIENGVDLYAVYGFMEFDNQTWTFIEAIPGPYLGDEVLPASPIVIGNTIDFGLSKAGPLSGSNGDGLLYTLRFAHNSPELQVDPALFEFNTIDIDAYNSFGQIGSLVNPAPSAIVQINFEVEVWPGDCDYNGVVNFLDLLPIGYFYSESGPIRPNPSIQWQAQSAPIWGVENEAPSSSFFKVFADSNGDGVINISDQAAIGFNLGQNVSEGFSEINGGFNLSASQLTGIPLSITASPTVATIPEEQEVVYSVFATTDSENLTDLFGFGLNVSFPTEWIASSEISVDYSNSDLGQLGVDFLSFTNVTSNSLEIAVTRTLPYDQAGSIHLFDLVAPLSENLLSGPKEIIIDVVAANDPVGNAVTIIPTSSFIEVVNQNVGLDISVVTSSTVCNGGGLGMAVATINGGTEPYVLDWNGANPTNLFPGNYVLTVTDSENISASINFTIQEGLALCGCVYPDATNYDPLAQVDNGSCDFPPSINTCQGDLNGDGFISTVDLLVFLALFNTSCQE